MKIRTAVRENEGNTYRYELNLTKGKAGEWKYSVRITLRSADGSISTEAEREIFGRESMVKCFFERLVKELVTPIDLPYVIEDEMCVH